MNEHTCGSPANNFFQIPTMSSDHMSNVKSYHVHYIQFCRSCGWYSTEDVDKIPCGTRDPAEFRAEIVASIRRGLLGSPA